MLVSSCGVMSIFVVFACRILCFWYTSFVFSRLGLETCNTLDSYDLCLRFDPHSTWLFVDLRIEWSQTLKLKFAKQITSSIFIFYFCYIVTMSICLSLIMPRRGNVLDLYDSRIDQYWKEIKIYVILYHIKWPCTCLGSKSRMIWAYHFLACFLSKTSLIWYINRSLFSSCYLWPEKCYYKRRYVHCMSSTPHYVSSKNGLLGIFM